MRTITHTKEMLPVCTGNFGRFSSLEVSKKCPRITRTNEEYYLFVRVILKAQNYTYKQVTFFICTGKSSRVENAFGTVCTG
jgi:hypothetical protein